MSDRNFARQRQQQGQNGPPDYNSFASDAASSASAAAAASSQSVASAASVAASTTNGASTISTDISLGTSATADLNSATSTDAAAVSTAASTSIPSVSTETTASTPAESTASAASTAQTQTTLQTSISGSGTALSDTLSSTTASSLHGASQTTLNPSAASSTTISAASEGSTLHPITNAGNPSGLSSSALGAAVAVPILFALLALLLAFLCMRRRSRPNRRSGAAFLPAMREKLMGGHSRDTSSASAAPAPVVTSNCNNAYFTGLDTSSHGSRSQRGQSGEYYAPARRSEGGTFDEPPPPYKAKSLSAISRASDISAAAEIIPPMAAATIPTLREPSPQHESEDSPFADPADGDDASSTHSTIRGSTTRNNYLTSPLDRPATSRSLSHRSLSRSINSDQYSETASLHSARAARMSVGGAQFISGAVGKTGGREDPFEDPMSPVSAMDNASVFGGLSRGNSAVSDLSARRR